MSGILITIGGGAMLGIADRCSSAYSYDFVRRLTAVSGRSDPGLSRCTASKLSDCLSTVALINDESSGGSTGADACSNDRECSCSR